MDDVLELKILEELKRNSGINQKELAKILGTSVPSVQRAMGKLKDSKRIVLRGGNVLAMEDIIQIYNHTSKICFDSEKIYLLA